MARQSNRRRAATGADTGRQALWISVPDVRDPVPDEVVQGDLSEAEKRANVLRLVFGGSDGAGTSVLDLTLVGSAALLFFKPSGFFVPGVHSRPLSDRDPDIAPDLVPLRDRLIALVRRPVNIQASREIVIQFRGDLLGQPYLTLFEKPPGISITDPRPA